MADHRIVSLIASATEIVAALGFGRQLVGRSHECDYPPGVLPLPVCSTSKVDVDASSRAIDDQVRSIVADGLSVYRVDPERLDRLAPTVVITQTQCEVCAVSLQDVERALCQVVGTQPALVSLEPMTLDDIWQDIRRVAATLGAPDQGEALVDSLTRRLDAVRQRVRGRATQPTIACLEWIDPLMSAGNWVPELVQIAGGRDPFGQPGRHAGSLTLNDLCDVNPDVIAFMPCGFDIRRCRRELGVLTSRCEWRRLSAVRQGRVFVTDGNQYFNRPGPRVVESAEILAELLHGDGAQFGHEHVGWVSEGGHGRPPESLK